MGYKQDLDDLKWFHDCKVQAISIGWKPVTRLQITVVCPVDLGLPRWDGKTVAIIADDISMLDYELRVSSDEDSISSIREGIRSTSLEAAIARSMKIGFRLPPCLLSICFSSGSLIQLLCNATRIVVA